jgi:ethanolamine utilization protein EutQ
MPTLIPQPTRIQAAGIKPKLIDEYIGQVNSKSTALSVAHMRSPAGWSEPRQTPEFDEYTVVLKGGLRVEHKGGYMDVHAGQAVIAHRGEWVQYSTRKAPNTLLFACRRSRRKRCTGKSDRDSRQENNFRHGHTEAQRRTFSSVLSRFALARRNKLRLYRCPELWANNDALG